MPGAGMAEIKEEGVVNHVNGMALQPNIAENPQNGDGNGGGEVIDTSIERLYENVFEMQSSDRSPSGRSFGSDEVESRIDSELRHLVGGEMREVEIMEEEIGRDEEVAKPDGGNSSASVSKNESSSSEKKSGKVNNARSSSTKSTSSGPLVKKKVVVKVKAEAEASSKLSPKSKSQSPLEKQKPPSGIKKGKVLAKGNGSASPVKKTRSSPAGGGAKKVQDGGAEDSTLGNHDLGPFLLKQARDLLSSGDNAQKAADNMLKALDLALRAAKSMEICANGKPSLELVMCLHVTAAIYCNLGRYNEAVPVLEKAIQIPVVEEGQDHALAKFAGHMQLGDTYAIQGQLENSIACYTTGLEIQRQALGDTDPRVGETCRYLAEALVQALQFDEAEKLCQMALDIHKANNAPASVEEAADRRLMGLICETKGDHESALEHLVLASMAMVSNGQESEVAAIDCSIGDTYLSLLRYDEAVFAYNKALTAFKASKGENHPSVASVFVRLAELYNKTGKLRESNSYCENALRIYLKPSPGIPPEEIASGLTDVSAIYESMDDIEQALKLLEKALRIYNDAPGQQSTVAGIEAQIGVMNYMLGNFSESYNYFKRAIAKLRANGEKKNAFFGVALNQMGLACVQCYAINEAAESFEESRTVLEQECGPYHPDTLGVYSNLAGTYDAMGRIDDAIDILEYVVDMREEKLGTANPDVDDEKRRLAELLKEAGRTRTRRNRSLETLLDATTAPVRRRNGVKV
uniref:Kinesin light chain n=1 Tax=Kalanchoe fedtschenkoi TaxID=63787 RepID=A0A7N0ZRY7_KALFE